MIDEADRLSPILQKWANQHVTAAILHIWSQSLCSNSNPTAELWSQVQVPAVSQGVSIALINTKMIRKMNRHIHQCDKHYFSTNESLGEKKCLKSF